MDGADDLAAAYSMQVDARAAEVGVSELPLGYDERDSFVRHLDRVGVSQGVEGEVSATAGLSSTRGR